MKKAIDETQRRREKQKAFNLEKGITPKGIFKDVKDIMEGAYVVPGRGPKKAQTGAGSTAEFTINPAKMTPKQLKKEITRIEDQMYKHAKNLEFEAAAQLRDQLSQLKNATFRS